jgi:putative salt-induced outer membrane protein YdiY
LALHGKKTSGVLDSGNRLLFTPLQELSVVKKRGNRRSQRMTTPFLTYLRVGSVFLFALSLACLGSPARELRKDVIVMTNGDRFTGQVKRLQNGLLFVEMPYASGNIGLDWNQVDSVQSTGVFQIILNNGQRLEGTIEKVSGEKAKNEDFLIREATEEVEIPSTSVANIDQKKPTFWRQLQGNIDFGYSFNSGNSQSSLNADTSATYKTRSWAATTSFDSTFSGQSGASSTNREDLQTTVSRFLNRNSFVSGLSDFLHSSRQDLTLRTTLGGGYGRYLTRTTNSNLAWLGGIVYINESFNTTAGQPSDQSMEAVVGLQYSYVRFNLGELDSQLRIFPGLTDSGRVRITTNNSLSIKLRNNFYLLFTFWDNFDSRPPLTARKNELGTSTGVGWSF